MLTQKSELGAWGEKLACEYLVEKGYRVLEINAKEKWGELDIVAQARDKPLVFVEVKTVTRQQKTSDKPQETRYGEVSAESQMTSAKIRKFKTAASLYAGSHQELINDKKGWRLDVIAITKNGDNCDIRHYENI